MINSTPAPNKGADNPYYLQVNSYGNVDCCGGIPDGWYEVCYSRRTYNRIRKLCPDIPMYIALTGWEKIKGFYKPELAYIAHTDHKQTIKDILARKEKEEEEKLKDKINKALKSKKKIAEALYVINKEAKRQRDIQEATADRIYGCYDYDGYDGYDGYDDYDDYVDYDSYRSRRTGDKLAHYRLQQAKSRKLQLYELKSEALRKIVREWGLSPQGYHTFSDGVSRDYYVIEGYGFHLDENTSQQYLGDIETLIPSQRKRSMNPNTAEAVLIAFVEQ